MNIDSTISPFNLPGDQRPFSHSHPLWCIRSLLNCVRSGCHGVYEAPFIAQNSNCGNAGKACQKVSSCFSSYASLTVGCSSVHPAMVSMSINVWPPNHWTHRIPSNCTSHSNPILSSFYLELVVQVAEAAVAIKFVPMDFAGSVATRLPPQILHVPYAMNASMHYWLVPFRFNPTTTQISLLLCHYEHHPNLVIPLYLHLFHHLIFLLMYRLLRQCNQGHVKTYHGQYHLDVRATLMTKPQPENRQGDKSW